MKPAKTETKQSKTPSREKDFTYQTLSDIRKDESLLADMLINSKILQSGDGRMLRKGDIYTNKKKDSLYFVMNVETRSGVMTKVESDRLYSSNNKLKNNRLTEVISGKLFDQEVHVLSVKRAGNEK
jgi:hypothetical protein